VPRQLPELLVVSGYEEPQTATSALSLPTNLEGVFRMLQRVQVLLVSVSVSVAASILLVGCSPAKVDTSAIERKWLDVSYASQSKAQVLDVYLPNRGSGPFPAIISIHGGGFAFGDRRGPDLAAALNALERGYAVVSVDYRLSGEAAFPKQIHDVKAAIRFVRAHAAQYDINPEKLAVWGSSAGGNLAALAGTTGQLKELEDLTLGHEGVSSRVQAVVDWYGPTDFSQMDAQAKAQGCGTSDQKHGAADSFESLYLGATVSEASELVQKANPISYITPDDPPFLLQKGDQDCTVPVGQSQLLADALQAAALDVQFDLLPGVGHGDSGTPVFESADNVQVVIDFLFTKLK